MVGILVNWRGVLLEIGWHGLVGIIEHHGLEVNGIEHLLEVFASIFIELKLFFEQFDLEIAFVITAMSFSVQF